ncbi:hypothetical protein GQ55_6G272600 [Panicum hallii var. hallii]|uniref:Uncharacterized protein n=1 Tax=Panicum hallii var. hallii TaxID=1504633 RepID=A0A2T7DA45_9POAL|nr:hypothetical protein GQ55_6G272600 [Panicum hallii var. hallii]
MWKPQPRRTVRRMGNRGRGGGASRLSSAESWVVVPWIRSGRRRGEEVRQQLQVCSV